MPAAPKEDPRESSFEGHLDALEKVVADLEGDDLSLEASIDRYKDGVDHLAACRRILDAAEKRLAELVARADGSGVDERPLEVGAEGLVDAGPPREPTAKRPSAPRGPRKAAPPSSAPADGDIPF